MKCGPGKLLFKVSSFCLSRHAGVGAGEGCRCLVPQLEFGEAGCCRTQVEGRTWESFGVQERELTAGGIAAVARPVADT